MRAAGSVRQALESVLRAGACGTYDVLAQRACVCPNKARTALSHLRRLGVAQSHSAPGGLVGRPPAVYGLAGRLGVDSVDALQFACRVWR